jgi:hypothetical protein
MEPERPIEKLLRESAKRRLEQSKTRLEMHPATRRVLQGEAARRFGKRAGNRASFRGWIQAFWPRLAWGVGVFSVLTLAAWLVLPPRGGGGQAGREELARNEAQPGAEL